MIKIKKLRMHNYCGFRDTEIDFTDGKNNINDISLFYGPNGEGKSTILNAVQILASPKEYIGRDLSLSFRKFIYHEDYDPSYHEIKLHEGVTTQDDMELEGIFATDDGDKKVVFKASGKRGGTSGIIVNELPLNPRAKNNNRNAYFIDADNPQRMHRFTLPHDHIDKFLDIAETVYGFNCILSLPTEDTFENEKHMFYDDFVIEKVRAEETVKVHFKRMSAGEKKIATLLRHLCNPEYIDFLDIILVDNIEMHVYFKRHPSMINKLMQHFPEKQFICTTHSETLINHVDEIRGGQGLFDLEGVHDSKLKNSDNANELEDSLGKWIKV